MPIPGQPMMPPPTGPVPGAMPPPQPGAAPSAGANPLAALSGLGLGGGLPRGQGDLMQMMAGMGLIKLLEQIEKMKGKQGGGGKSAMAKDAAGNPAQTQVGPQLLAQLAARRAQAQQGMGASPVGGANPLAALMGR